jgi:hypothetical protein
MADYSFTLQAVMELQKTVGQLAEGIDSLIRRVDQESSILSKISHQIYAAWAVLVVLGIIGGFAVNHLWTPMAKLFVFSMKLPQP